MPVFLMLSHIVLVITAVVLFYVTYTDLKSYTIRNELIRATGARSAF